MKLTIKKNGDIIGEYVLDPSYTIECLVSKINSRYPNAPEWVAIRLEKGGAVSIGVEVIRTSELIFTS